MVDQSSRVHAWSDAIGGTAEDDYRCAVYQTTYVAARNDIADERLNRRRYPGQIREGHPGYAGQHADVAREAVDDALAGLPMSTGQIQPRR